MQRIQEFPGRLRFHTNKYWNQSTGQEKKKVLGESGKYKTYCIVELYIPDKAARQTTRSRLVQLGSYLLRGNKDWFMC